jgi:IS5 family transposase
MKAHIGVDAQSGLVHTVRGTAANVNDVVEANSLLHGQETDVFADAGYQGAAQATRRQAKSQLAHGHAAGQAQGAGQGPPWVRVIDQIERLKASIGPRSSTRSA